jgi:tetratricopeptide (TPR) repeat protein
MAADGWYRNTEWNAAIEADFRARLNRARSGRSQYLRIQAGYLAESHPRVALGLLDEFFASGDHVDAAQAHVDRARAHVALGDLEAAIKSYEDALERERVFPHVRSNAYADFACLVVNERVASLYPRALEVLDERADDPLFPIQRYRKHGARALLLEELGRPEEAVLAASAAMEAARQVHSGFRHHPDLGLVDTEDEFGRRVVTLARRRGLQA